MRTILPFFSYLFHPLFIPIAGTLSCFWIAPYIPLELQNGNLLPIFILTIIVPIVFFFILKNLGLVQSVFAPSLKERRYPLFLSILIYGMILFKVIPLNFVPELYYFFVGLVIASLALLLLLFLKVKGSVHLLGMGSILMYMVSLSIHYERNITPILAVATLLTGLVATSRLYLGAHSRLELAIGVMIGMGGQLLTVAYWL